MTVTMHICNKSAEIDAMRLALIWLEYATAMQPKKLGGQRTLALHHFVSIRAR